MLFACNLLIIVHVELPPAKRRRTLAGSIVSTALSAALISTAVGLTVYRLCVLNSIRSPLFAQPCFFFFFWNPFLSCGVDEPYVGQYDD